MDTSRDGNIITETATRTARKQYKCRTSGAGNYRQESRHGM